MTKRQLTVREKLLLGLLAVTALVSGYLMLFYNPMLQKRDRMRAEIETCQSQLELAQIRVAEKQRMERELKELFEKDPPPRSLAPYDNSQAVMLELHGILSAAEDYSLAFSTVEAEESIANESKARSLLRDKVTEEEIARIIERWTGIPVSRLMEGEREKLLHLEDILHRRVVGQEEAVRLVSEAILRSRAGIADPDKPIGSFLFLGPTGVGKTELAKSLAAALFDDENNMVRIDMSEYMEKYSVSRLIGAPPGYVGYEEGGQLTEAVRRKPYSVVLFDEIEKAHPDVFNVLLQVLDDGHITDSKGRKVSFKNTILIMTSNAGAQRIIDPKNLGFGTQQTKQQDYDKMKSNVMEEVKRLFKPEFINRIDEIMVFHPLNKEDMKKIITLLAGNLIRRCREQMDIQLTITSSVKDWLIEKHIDTKMGARPMKRAIQSEIEDALAEEILSGRVKGGDQVTAGLKNKKIVFTVKKTENGTEAQQDRKEKNSIN